MQLPVIDVDMTLPCSSHFSPFQVGGTVSNPSEFHRKIAANSPRCNPRISPLAAGLDSDVDAFVEKLSDFDVPKLEDFHWILVTTPLVFGIFQGIINHL